MNNTIKFVLLAASVSLALVACDSTETVTPDLDETPAAQPDAHTDALGHFDEVARGNLRYPVRLAVAQDGTIYLSDFEANRVLGYRDGQLVRSLSDLDRPLGVAVHGDLLYVGSHGRHALEVYDLTGRTPARTLAAVEMPAAIAVAPDGTIYVADSKDHLVRIFSPDGSALGQIGGLGKGDGQLRFPSAVAVDADRVVVADQGNHRLQVFDRQGEFQRTIGEAVPRSVRFAEDFQGRFTRVQGLALTADRIFALDSYHARVQVFDADGVSLGSVGERGTCGNCVALALDVAVNARGQLLVADPDRRRWVTLSAQEVSP